MFDAGGKGGVKTIFRGDAAIEPMTRIVPTPERQIGRRRNLTPCS